MDLEGKQKGDISWIVLFKNNESMLLISEKILDYKEFSRLENNNWDESDLKKWLNTAFLNESFSEEEKARLIDFSPEEKVSLLDLEGYENFDYFPNYTTLKAERTDYALSKTKNIYGELDKRKFGFWWLKTPNKEKNNNSNSQIKFTENTYVCHVCNTGKLNKYERATYKDGVRPIIRIKL